MDPELIQQILFWVAVVFAAGFIGYFGRYLSKLILAKVHKKGPHGSKEEKPKTKEEYDYLLEKEKLKLEKKKMKMEEERKESEEKRREKEAERREKMREKREK